MRETQDLIEKLSELCDSAPEEHKPNIVELFEELITHVKARIDFDRIQPELKKIPLFRDRADKGQSSMSFFLENYGRLVASGIFYIDNLRHHDQRLYTTLSSYQAERGAKLSDLLPRRPNPTRGGPRPISELKSVKFG